MKYIVYDRTGHPVGVPFNNYKDAATYKTIYGRQDWTIKTVNVKLTRKSTNRQKAAVAFVEEWLGIDFEGNLDDFYEVSDFLAEYLQLAKDQYEEVKCEYESYLWEMD